ncbi:NAD(P)/FAD-dependent oxidoreductase [Synechococcus sp. CBW1002]|uniref:FAD-dependent monooxygenase n=1 Tax=Synechococcus sp. CBW1002 TaxID=1353134 RepID=UPI001E64EFD3|nr:NAD(P)/FAD-dependent oxidoreductase [Synechococcus sp. CBW1002]
MIDGEHLTCDVLIVGAGPSGGHLARLLASHGVDVLLVDQLPDLRRAAFSSAALPIEAVASFGLPAEVVASRWRSWQLIGPAQASRHWSSAVPLGVVLDFGALRLWLAEQCRCWGGRVELGLRALGCQEVSGGLLTHLRRSDGCPVVVRSSWVVDASGQGRALLGDPSELVVGRGVEWLLQVDPSPAQRWADQLTFLLGSDWVPQGYGWVFPMQCGRLKLGVCRLDQPLCASSSSRQRPLGPDLQTLLCRLDLDGARVLDRHGGLIRSRIDRREPHGRGRLIGLGDAVSTANLLGGEGIRHALASAGLLAPLLLQERDPDRLRRRYQRQLSRHFGWRWPLSGRLARRTWLALRDRRADHRLERLLAGLETCEAADLSALLFDYCFERYGLRALPYLLGWR